MTPALEVHLTSGQGFLVVELRGEIDLASVPPVRERLVTIARLVPGVVIIDLAEVTFLDSTALGLFVEMHRMLTPRGKMLLLANVRPSVGRPIAVTGLDRVFPVTYTDEPARPWNQPVELQALFREFALPDTGPPGDDAVTSGTAPPAE